MTDCRILAIAWHLAAVVAALIHTGAAAAEPTAHTPADHEFFEAKVRPLLVTHCAECHSAEAGDPEAGLSFDSRADFFAAEGVAMAGKPDQSLLVHVVRWRPADAARGQTAGG